MNTDNPLLPSGYSPVPPGRLAAIVTCLETRSPPSGKTIPVADPSLHLEHWPSPDPDAYRQLFRSVGEQWMWVSRLVMEDGKLTEILQDPRVEIFRLLEDGRPIGLAELDFRQEGECELSFFGLAADAIGKGAGRFMMDQAVARAWSRPIGRFWVHTCNLDSPAALPFYQRAGFRPYAMMVEVFDDPRLLGIVPRTASPHIPLLEP